MNQQQLQGLLQTAQQCGNYLGQTNRGAIQAQMRQYTIYSLNALSTTVTTYLATQQNLQQQLANANAIIAMRDATIVKKDRQILKLTADARRNGQVIDEKHQNELTKKEAEADAKLAAAKADLEAAAVTLASDYDATMEKLKAEYEARLAAAQAEVESAKKSKRNSNKTMIQLLQFCLTQELAIIGYMHKHYNIDHFDMSIIERLLRDLQQDEDLHFEDDSILMETIRMMEMCTFGSCSIKEASAQWSNATGNATVVPPQADIIVIGEVAENSGDQDA